MTHRTEGHRLLAQSGKSQAEVVRGTSRSAPTVLRWFHGGKPDIPSAIALREFLGIPLEAWAQRPQRGKGRKAA